jgi:threonine dehydratase
LENLKRDNLVIIVANKSTTDEHTGYSMNNLAIPSKSELEEAFTRIQPLVNKTPIITSHLINDIAGTEIYFKCENFQKIGAFKFRGAINAVLQLTEEERANGVATHSSGNHAQALALAAKINNIKAYIVVPTTAPKVKSAAVADYGAEIIWCEPTLVARETTLEKVVQETGATVVHPYDNQQVICGQSTVVQEILKKIDNLNIVIAPVGGGGLLSGTALWVKYNTPNIKVIAAEPEGADDAYRSLKEGKLIPSVNPDTIADGLLTSLSNRTFDIIQQYVDDIFTANDAEILAAMHLIWERMKIIVEPSSAVALAIVLKNKQYFKGKRLAIIISGGNVDLKKFSFS